jgi:RimJ/RimL family protein N-acetyltransferase
MRDNQATMLVGRRVRLVPYRPEHIATYHAWMQDEELLRLTCSEPLSLEEETANQRSWCEDPSKVTFIICALGTAGSDDALTTGMCGDVNAFLSPAEDDEAGGDAASSAGLSAELEVMIADKEQRRRGLARESLQLFVHWLLNHVPVTSLVVKITDDNVPSIRLFEALGFAVHRHLAVFEQTELRADVATARAACAQHFADAGARELRLDEGPGDDSGSALQRSRGSADRDSEFAQPA